MQLGDCQELPGQRLVGVVGQTRTNLEVERTFIVIASARHDSNGAAQQRWDEITPPSGATIGSSVNHTMSPSEKKFPEVQGGGSLILAWQIRGKKVVVIGGGEVCETPSATV